MSNGSRHSLRRVWLAAVLCVVLTTGCDDAPQAQNGFPAPEVTVSEPIKRKIVEWDSYAGRFAAVDTVEIRARVSGYLDSVHFKDGQLVNQGDLLFVIDPRQYEAAHEQVQAELAQAQARFDLASLDLDRAGPLIDRGNISQENYDERAQLKREAAAAVQAAEARRKETQLNLDFTRVTAPVSGRVSRKMVTVGNLVNGGDFDPTLLTTIVSLDPIHFYFDADQKAYLKYVRLDREGKRPSSRTSQTPVYLALPDEKEFRHRGYMDFLDNQVDFSSGTMRGRAVFDNSDFVFIPGLFARIRMPGSGEYEALLLPEEVIGTDQSQKFVFVVDEEGSVIHRPVELGPVVDGLRVIRSGLSGEERVIVNGLQRARSGAKVTPLYIPLEPPKTTASMR